MSINLQSQAAGEASFMGLVRRQMTKPVPLPTGIRLTDQIAIVTGSNAGVGLAASRHLLSLGLSRLIMGVRSQAKGDKVAAELRKEYPRATVTVWILDMESYTSIQSFVGQCATLSRLDIVILNAGLGATTYGTAAETGHEVTMQVNYLSTALLTILLLPVLKKSPRTAGRPPTLTMVSSDVAYTTTIDNPLGGPPLLKRYDDAKKFDQLKWYSISKLLLTYFGWKLAEQVNPDEVLVNLSNPGMTAGTEFFAKSSFIIRKIMGLMQAFLARTPAIGATNYIDAVLVEGAKSHGSFVSDWTIKPYPSAFYTAEGRQFRDRLWEETIEEFKNVAGASRVLESLKK